MDEIKKEIKEIQRSLNNIDVTLAKQHVSLEEHIRRTNLLEQKLEPIDTHVKMVNGAFKFIGILSLIVGIVVSLIKVI